MRMFRVIRMTNKEKRINVLENLLRAVVAVAPIGNYGTYIENHATIVKICEDEEHWLDTCNSLCNLLHDFI